MAKKKNNSNNTNNNKQQSSQKNKKKQLSSREESGASIPGLSLVPKDFNSSTDAEEGEKDFKNLGDHKEVIHAITQEEQTDLLSQSQSHSQSQSQNQQEQPQQEQMLLEANKKILELEQELSQMEEQHNLKQLELRKEIVELRIIVDTYDQETDKYKKQVTELQQENENLIRKQVIDEVQLNTLNSELKQLQMQLKKQEDDYRDQISQLQIASELEQQQLQPTPQITSNNESNVEQQQRLEKLQDEVEFLRRKYYHYAFLCIKLQNQHVKLPPLLELVERACKERVPEQELNQWFSSMTASYQNK